MYCVISKEEIHWTIKKMIIPLYRVLFKERSSSLNLFVHHLVSQGFDFCLSTLHIVVVILCRHSLYFSDSLLFYCVCLPVLFFLSISSLLWKDFPYYDFHFFLHNRLLFPRYFCWKIREIILPENRRNSPGRKLH